MGIIKSVEWCGLRFLEKLDINNLFVIKSVENSTNYCVPMYLLLIIIIKAFDNILSILERKVWK